MKKVEDAGASADGSNAFPITPDGRYFVDKGRLWRLANPNLPQTKREQLVRALMEAGVLCAEISLCMCENTRGST